MSEPMLELRGVGASYGAIQALHDVSLKVERGAIVALQERKDGSALTALVSTDGLAWNAKPVAIPDYRAGMRVALTSVAVEGDHLLLLVALTGPTAKRTVVVPYAPPR